MWKGGALEIVVCGGFKTFLTGQYCQEVKEKEEEKKDWMKEDDAYLSFERKAGPQQLQSFGFASLLDGS